MEKRPNDYDGFSYFIKDHDDIELLDPRAKILLEPNQISFLKDYHKNLENMVKKAAPLAEIPNLAKWLASLWNIAPVMEVHTSSDIYDMSAVWLRFPIREEDPEEDQTAWKPAINLLGYRGSNQFRVPNLLTQVLNITGEINHNGYGLAGRLHHPDRVGDEITFYETLKNDSVFYRLPHLEVFWEFHGGFYESEEERREFGLYFFDDGLAYFLDLYFGSLLDQQELRIDREGNVVS